MDVRVINELVHKQSAFVEKLNAEVGKVIVGQKTMIERILIGMLTGGHVLLVGLGAPGRHPAHGDGRRLLVTGPGTRRGVRG